MEVTMHSRMVKNKAVMVIIAVVVLSGCKGKVDQIKSSVWEGDKATTLGKALDNYKGFDKKSWTLIKTDNGKEIVEFTGDLIPPEATIKQAEEMIVTAPKIREQIKNDDRAMYYYSQGNIHNYKEVLGDDIPVLKGFKIDSSNIELARAFRPKVEKQLNEALGNAEKIKSFYAGGNKLQVIYQFALNEDKTFDIVAAGCQTSQDKQRSNFLMTDPSTVLKKIYDSNSIEGACLEPN
jgi:major membrane immunogen (membrane-anchored lipoprotein)